MESIKYFINRICEIGDIVSDIKYYKNIPDGEFKDPKDILESPQEFVENIINFFDSCKVNTNRSTVYLSAKEVFQMSIDNFNSLSVINTTLDKFVNNGMFVKRINEIKKDLTDLITHIQKDNENIDISNKLKSYISSIINVCNSEAQVYATYAKNLTKVAIDLNNINKNIYMVCVAKKRDDKDLHSYSKAYDAIYDSFKNIEFE